MDPIIREVIRIDAVDQTVETEDDMETIDLEKTIKIIIFEETLKDMEDKIIERNTEISEAGIGQEKGHFSMNYGHNRDRSSSNSRSRSGS